MHTLNLNYQKRGAGKAAGSVKPPATLPAGALPTTVARTALLVAALLFLPAAGLFAITGEEVAQKVYNRDTGQTMHSLAELNLIESDGKTSNRIIENWTKDPENGTGASVIVFHKPASVQNTRFLTVENESGSDDQWIYLPGLGRVRRIAASEGDSSFMGTDFTYDDMQTREVDQDTHTLLREEEAGGRDCYVVESVPKDPSDSQYSKRIQWIAKEIWVPMKVEFYDQDEELLKTLTVERLEKVQGIWTTINTTIENQQTGHATEMNVQKLVYNEDLPDSLFTTNFLRTGRK